MLETVPCNNCHSLESRYLFKSTERVCKTVPKGIWCNIVRCKSCGFIYLNPRVKEKEIGQFYPSSEYYTLQDNSNDSKVKRIKDDLFKMTAYLFFKYPKNFIQLKSGLSFNSVKLLSICSYPLLKFKYRRIPEYIPNGKILEFGFGAGDYLCKLKDLGWECWGVELSTTAFQKMHRANIKAYANLWDQNISPNYFDWITSYHSIEHVYNPLDILKRFNTILKPGGKAYIGLPNFDSFAARFFRRFWYDLGVPIHPHVFSKTSIKKMLFQAKFQIERIDYRSITQGLLGSSQIALNALLSLITNKKRTSMFLRDFAPLKILCIPFVKFFDLIHFGDRIEIIVKKN